MGLLPYIFGRMDCHVRLVPKKRQILFENIGLNGTAAASHFEPLKGLH